MFEDKGGSHHWTIVGASGEILVHCASFASHEEAKQAARIMHASASLASLERPTRDTPPIDLVARRATRLVRREPDAEWELEERGSVSANPGQAESP